MKAFKKYMFVMRAAFVAPVCLLLHTQAGWTADADADWLARSTAPGVTMATRFDTEAEVTDWTHNNSNADHVSWQTIGQASGGGALRFDVLKTDVKDSGNWVRWLSDEIDNSYPNGHREFYAGDTIFVQYRILVPTYRAEHVFLGGGGWKTSIMSRHNQNMVYPQGVGKAGSNQTNEIVINNRLHRGLIGGYNQNGKGRYPAWNSGRNTACSNSDVVFQPMVDRGPSPLSGTNPANGQPWTACEQDRARYGGLFSYYPEGGGSGAYGKPDPLTGGFTWYPNEWLTIYYRLDIGQYGVDSTSTINLWASRTGDTEYTHLVQHTITLGGTGIDNAYDALWLLPYNTKMEADPSRQDTFVLYDEVVVSTAPIAVPGNGGYIESIPPAPPTNLISD